MRLTGRVYLASAFLLCSPSVFADDAADLDARIEALCKGADAADKGYWAMKKQLDQDVPDDPEQAKAMKSAFLAMDEKDAEARTDKLWKQFEEALGYAQTMSGSYVQYFPYVKQKGTRIQKNQMDCFCEGLETGLYEEPDGCPLIKAFKIENWNALRKKLGTLSEWTGLDDALQRVELAISIHEEGMANLEKDVAAANPKTRDEAKPFEQRLAELDQTATRARDLLQKASQRVDQMGSPTEKTQNGWATQLSHSGQLTNDRINPLQERFAKLALRLQRMHCRLGAHAPGDADEIASSELSEEACVGKLQTPPSGMGARAPSLLHTPAPSLGLAQVDPKSFSKIESGGILSKLGISPEGRDRWRKEDYDPAGTDAILAQRDKGQTRTVGDPVGRSGLVFPQTGGTCAIATQVQLAADSMKPRPTPEQLKKMEDEYYKKAASSNWFGGHDLDPNRRASSGVPQEYYGDLLPMPMKKHFNANEDELNAAVKSGKMIMVTADAGRLWNDIKFAGAGHAVVITGAELDPTGKVLGYYINDTGRQPPDGGRFVKANQLTSAWYGSNNMFVEPL
jgi:hypothetical protein